MKVNWLSVRRLRTNTESYTYMPYENIGYQVRMQLGSSIGPGYAILLPRRSGTIKLVSPEMCELYSRLNVASLVPQHIIDLLGDQASARIGALVYDGILEVEGHTGWVSGPDVAVELGVGAMEIRNLQANGEEWAVIANYVQSTAPAWWLARRLYLHGRMPYSTFYDRLVDADPSTLRNWYGLGSPPVSKALANYWTMASLETSEWWLWSARQPRRTRSDGVAWKLYLNPHPLWMPIVASLVIPLLIDFGAHSFKIVGASRSLMRSDKFVIYFHSREDLIKSVQQAARLLEGIPAQPALFTAVEADGGLITSAVDPPAKLRATKIPFLEEGSWRWWVCTRVASAIFHSKMASNPLLSIRHRLEAEGISTVRWAASPELLREWYSYG